MSEWIKTSERLPLEGEERGSAVVLVIETLSSLPKVAVFFSEYSDNYNILIQAWHRVPNASTDDSGLGVEVLDPPLYWAHIPDLPDDVVPDF